MSRAPRPDDLYRLRVATEPRLSPDGAFAVVTLKTVAPGLDGYRQAIWLVPVHGSREPRRLTLGVGQDHAARFSPDGRTLAFLSDRGPLLERDAQEVRDRQDGRVRVPAASGIPKDPADASQVYLLPLDGGEARRLTDLPRGVDAFEWSPDGSRLVVVSASLVPTREADARRRGTDADRAASLPPESDYRFIDRLDYMLTGKGFTYDRVPHLWLVDAETGVASRLTDGPVADREPAWSPDGRRVLFAMHTEDNTDLYTVTVPGWQL
ncbi:MAG: PD40 domain-containing protein [Chloroflexi bacterium]|nr:PD40 domain-containing protein [Chloroflexota bacterium]